MINIFKFEMGQRVKLVESDKRGVIVGRAEYSNRPPQYLIRYKAGDGRMVENWWLGGDMELEK